MRKLLVLWLVCVGQLSVAQPTPHLFLMGRRTTLPGSSLANVPTATLTQNGQLLLYESGIGDVYMQSLTEQAATPFKLTGGSRKITALATAADSRWVAMAHRDSVLAVRADQGRVVWRVACAGAVSLVFSPNGQTLAAGLNDGRIRLYNVPDGRELRTLPGFQAEGVETPCQLLQFGASGRELIAAIPYRPTILVWSVGDGKLTQRLAGHVGSIQGISLSPNGKRLASVSSDNRLKIWSLRTYKCIATSTTTCLFDDVTYTHQPGYVVARRNEQTLGLWRIDSTQQTATEINKIKLPDPVGRCYALNNGHSMGFVTRHYVAEVGVMDQPLLSATRCDTCHRRIALVIGNSDYRHYAEWSLQGIPRNDAIAMEHRLSELDFQVTKKLDLTADAMQREVAAFRKRIRPGQTEMALIYFAGHGASWDGKNYLLPVDLRWSDTTSLQRQRDSVALKSIHVEQLADDVAAAGPQLCLLILDACRNDPTRTVSLADRPLSRGFRPILKQKQMPVDTYIALATHPGKTALNRCPKCNNSVYTNALLQHLKRGVRLEDIFRAVRKQVADATDNEQFPEVIDRLSTRPDNAGYQF